MARTVQELTYRLIADEKELVRGLKKASDRTEALGQKFQKTGKLLTAGVTLPIIGIGAAFIKVAADAEETNSKFNAVFKSQSEEVRAWADEFATSVGRSATEQLGFLSTIQDTLVPLGILRGKASEMSKATITLATDLAAFNNLPTEQVVRDIQSALVGNTETLRKYGVVASQEAIVQEALTSGLIGQKNELDATTKAQAIFNLAQQGTIDAQGAAIRTAGDVTSQLKALKSEATELAIEMGTMLLPIFTDAVQSLRNVVSAFSSLDESTQSTILKVAGFAAVMGPAIIILGKAIPVVNELKTALRVMRTVGLGPLGVVLAVVTAAIGGLVAGFSAISKARHEENIQRIKKQYGALADEIGRTAEEVAILEKIADEAGAKMDNGIPAAVREYDNLIETLGITVEQFEELNQAARRVGGDVEVFAEISKKSGLAGDKLQYAAFQMQRLQSQGLDASQSVRIIADQLGTSEANIVAVAAQAQFLTGEYKAQLTELNRQNEEYEKMVEYGMALDSGLIARVEAAKQNTQEIERQADAEREKVVSKERQIQLEKQYTQARSEVLSILESEKTEAKKLEEQIANLSSMPWGSGELEEERIEAISILQQRLKEAREQESADLKSHAEKTKEIYTEMQSGITSVIAQSFTNRKAELDNWYSARRATIESEITDEDEKAAAIEKLDKGRARKAAQIARDEAAYKKTASIVQATINTIEGVTKALSTGNIILAGVIGGIGAAQVAALAAQPLPNIPSFATGGSFTVPPGFNNDSYPLPAAMAQSGERVTVETVEQQALSNNGGSQEMVLQFIIDGKVIAENTVNYIKNGKVTLEVGA